MTTLHRHDVSGRPATEAAGRAPRRPLPPLRSLAPLRSPRRRGIGATGWAFLLPTILVFGYFAWWPIARSVVLSFQSTNLVDPPEWVGLSNFVHLFQDPLLWTTVRNTVWFVLLALVLGFPLPVLLAVVMSELRRFGGLFRVLVYLPVAVPPVVAVLMWKWFYDPDFGLFNQVLGLVGLGPLPWLQDTATAMPSLVLEATWAAAGSTVLIYLAALTSVPSELYEAAEIDGASIWRKFWHVTLPHLRGVLLIMLLLQIIGTFRVFTEPFVLTDGGPEDSTVTILLLIYRYAFVHGDYGMAAALGVLLAAALGVVSGVYLRVTRRWSNA
ncbi:sugar ABC transporter permease [Streptosporangium fragile]|uniref:Sugar ABC transporter permease n=1 Tax=Streptosporangium fragile TaxID=46186 RepID=A0ABP6I8D9_9ACTN